MSVNDTCRDVYRACVIDVKVFLFRACIDQHDVYNSMS